MLCGFKLPVNVTFLRGHEHPTDLCELKRQGTGLDFAVGSWHCNTDASLYPPLRSVLGAVAFFTGTGVLIIIIIIEAISIVIVLF